MEITPEKPQPYTLKGYCLEKLGKYNEAIASLSIAMGYKTGMLTNAEKESVLEARARCYDALGMKDKAAKDSAEANRVKKLPDAPASRPTARAAVNS
jgi:tetratricopeptide (TPR) repeat protein